MQRLTLKSWRFYSVAAAMLCLVALVVWRIASLQVLPGAARGFEFLQGQGNARTLRSEPVSAYRGVITDRNGEPLAVSTPVESLWANPQILLRASEHWSELAQAIGWNRAELEAKLSRFSGKEFMYLERHLPPQRARQIMALDIPGVNTQREYRRFYPAGSVAAQLVGITDVDDRGQEGVELAFDAWLAGESGKKQVIKDRRGRTVKELGVTKAARSGRPLALSIDLRLQYLAHRELEQAVQRFGARAGSAVVLDAHTGEVLAMVNQPTYNPNDRSDIRPANLRNRALTDVFEPGSTVKPLAMTAALQTGRFHPATRIDTSPGWVVVGDKTLKDPVDYGELDLTSVIVKSSQVGMTKLALDMEPEAVRRTYQKFGLGQGAGTGFPGEAVGLLPSHTNWDPIQRATYTFGYGLNLSLVQLAQAYSVLATGGLKRPISLLRQDERPAGERVVGEHHARDVTNMLRQVVTEEGTGTLAAIDAYTVAGKTGTAHKSNVGGYADDRYIGSFVGMAPAEDPRIVVAVMIDEPNKAQYHGGQVAAPVFSAITGGVLRLLQEPPENGGSRVMVEKRTEPASGPVARADYTGGSS